MSQTSKELGAADASVGMAEAVNTAALALMDVSYAIRTGKPISWVDAEEAAVGLRRAYAALKAEGAS